MNFPHKTKAVSILFLFLLPSLLHSAKDRIIVPAKINGEEIHLAFDTGSDRMVIYRKTAERLNLEVIESPNNTELRPGNVRVNKTEKCELSIGGTTAITEIAVYDTPASLKMDTDGVVSWSMFKSGYLMIDGEKNRLGYTRQTSESFEKWDKWKIAKFDHSKILGIEVPGRDGKTGVIIVDTGAIGGIAINERLWETWKNKAREYPLTLRASYQPFYGITVNEVSWADRFSYFKFKLRDVPVEEAPKVEAGQYGDYYYIGTLGLFSLKGLHFVIDLDSGYVYTGLKNVAKADYEYNKAGSQCSYRET